MNKELREEMEYLITCDDKAITPDVRDDVQMTLDYINELENKIDKAIEYIDNELLPFGDEWHWDNAAIEDSVVKLRTKLRGEYNESN